MVDALETLTSVVVGPCVVSGMSLSPGVGLQVVVTAGLAISRSAYPFAAASTPVPANSTVYLWANEVGDLQTTSSSVAPSVHHVCLGTVTSGPTSVTSTSFTGRNSLSASVSATAQTAGVATVGVSSSDVVLTPSQYGRRVIRFVGALTANVRVIVPPTAGFEWTVVDASTGPFTVTMRTLAGAGVVLTHTRTCKLWCDGENVLRVTPDV